MGLNIKDEHVHELARELASRTGSSQTSAVEQALARMLSQLDEEPRRRARRTRIDAVLRDVDARLEAAGRPSLSTAELYDESGLPT